MQQTCLPTYTEDTRHATLLLCTQTCYQHAATAAAAASPLPAILEPTESAFPSSVVAVLAPDDPA